MQHPDFCIAGAGIIGLSLALELHRRGATVTVLEKSAPLLEASSAAAGMLAAHDPENPEQLRPLADLSLSLYPQFLEQIKSLSGTPVPFQTTSTLQSSPHVEGLPTAELQALLPQLNVGSHHFLQLDEQSVDPRQLAQALLAAVRVTAIDLRAGTPVQRLSLASGSIEVHTPAATFTTSRFIDCTGAWSAASSHLPPFNVVPRKGQMLSVALPSDLPLDLVVRSPDIYIVPRTQGPHAGRAIIGATIEDCGFDKTVHSADIARLRAAASQLLPPLASATILEAWAGLRPCTPDGLPLLGALPDRPQHFLATGHYRNGILLAPATAHLMAQLLFNEPPSLDLAPFSPARNLKASV
jgi:glycine oxidase